MGWGNQVHEQTNKRGACTYYLVDGGYLHLSPEHYHLHLCHLKATKIEQMTNTLQLSRKNITKPTITHTDKVMHTISVCEAALKEVARGKISQDHKDLQQIVELSGRTVSKYASAMEQETAKHTPPPPRVQHTTTQIT